MSDNVTKLKTQPDRKEIEQPGCDVSFEQTIGEGRVMRFSTTFFQGTPVGNQKEIVEHLLSIADHVKARYELHDLRAQLAIRETATARSEEDVKRIDERHGKRKAEIKVEIDALNLAQAERAQAFERTYREANRGGSFTMSVAQKREIEGIRQDIAKLNAESLKIDETQSNERRDCMTALTRTKQDIATLKEEIAKRLLILGVSE